MNDDHDLKRHDVVYGATINLKLWNIWEGLIMAAFRGAEDEVFRHDITIDMQAHFDSVRERLAQSVWVKERALMALFVASHRGHFRLVQKLIEINADVNGKTPSNRTPLHAAAVMGHDDCVQLLLENGAHLDIRDCNKMTPLILAEKYGRKGCVRQLFLHKWKIRASVMNTKIPIESLMTHQKYDSGLITWLRGPEGKIYLADLRNNIPESLLRDAAKPPAKTRQRSHSTEINTDKYSLYKKVSTKTTMTREKHFHEASIQADLSRRGREAREAREREQREKELREQEAMLNNQNGDDDSNQTSGDDPVNPNRGRSQSITHKTPMPRISIAKSMQKSTTNLKGNNRSVPLKSMTSGDGNKLNTSSSNFAVKSANIKVRAILKGQKGKVPFQNHRSIVEKQLKMVDSTSSADDSSDIEHNFDMTNIASISRSPSPSLNNLSPRTHGRPSSSRHSSSSRSRSISPQSTQLLDIRLPGEITTEMEANKRKRIAKHRARREYMELVAQKRKESRPKSYKEWLSAKSSVETRNKLKR
ncbi:uncharacterized protein TRIADDRAFT_52568 [Trichoplax adhaerens]|uniref:Uncharacterized protein n=1 Tax=Trichoplax adhaerens TaxID=10228 RepID=B3RJ47_TRIAD|nr:hypothetical protein TRIADDRAFT_52568 [Trichoplax adhaerens]EDV29060.1 hypothetical protein TRIADDRAFT_52568 [Trichoplax adhaerens]|eukprot:XP_002108262.1 hypothetical protein TRIADDRAFT_52568 [Trichoplax adhaerens]